NDWPAAFLIIETEAVRREGTLAALEPYVLARLEWPSQASAVANLQQFLGQAATGRCNGFMNGTTTGLAHALALRLVAHTPSLERHIEALTLAASHDVTVLLTGPTGTGKTHLA